MSTPSLSMDAAAEVSAAVLRPGTALCVDLDGTLVKSDTLIDSVLALARQRPAELLQIPGWIAQGKAAFKRHVTASVELDVEHLPYNTPLLEYLRVEHAAGRKIYLATAADKTLAERVAAYLGIFAGVLASDGATNLAGGNKLAAFRASFGDDFCYIGNARPDVELLAACVAPMVANPDRALRSGMKRKGTIAAASFHDRESSLRSWLKAIRLHQWAKNTLIFVPLLLAHRWNPGTFAGAGIAFLSFGLCASATYIINDLLDLEADRRHPRKRRRPFASGDLSAIAGVVMVVLLMVAAVVLAVALPHIVSSDAGVLRTLQTVQLPRLARVLHRHHAELLALPQAQAVTGCLRTQWPVHGASAGGQRGHRTGLLAVAGWLQRLLLPVAGLRQALL